MTSIVNKIFVGVALVGGLYFAVKIGCESNGRLSLVSYLLLIGYPAVVYRIICGKQIRSVSFSFGLIATFLLFITIIWPYYTFVHDRIQNFDWYASEEQFLWPWKGLLCFFMVTLLNAWLLKILIRKSEKKKGSSRQGKLGVPGL